MSTKAATGLSGSVQVDLGGDGAWLNVLACVIIVEFAWWGLCCRAGIVPLPYVGRYVVLSLGALGAAIGLRRAVGARASRAAWASVVLATLLIAAGASLFLPLKYAIPRQVPFWLDVPLALCERALFGTDPWSIADHTFGFALVPIDRVYALWLPVQSVVLFCIVLLPPSEAKSRALVAYCLAWFLLGVVAATLLSSVGPIFHDRLLGGHQFAGLAARLRRGDAWMVLSESDAMWSSFAGSRPGFVAGISAMPSLHVAISTWMWFAARTLAPRASPIAFGYAMFMWAASVELGWHYVSDGLAGVLGMVAIWCLARSMCPKVARLRSHSTVGPSSSS